MQIQHPFTQEEAADIGKQLGIDWTRFDVEQFHKGLNIELEQSLRHPEANVTNNNPLLIGKVALAHLNEFPDYYTRLEHMVVNAKKGTMPIPHYYGNLIRKFFMVAAVVILIGVPFVGSFLSIFGFFAILGALLLGILAGLTSPENRGVMLANLLMSVIGFIVFETFAIMAYENSQAFLVVIGQALAILFLTSTYYATKTWRGILTK